MADVRVQQAIKIVDPTTNANEAAVDAGGNLQVILATNTGVDIGDVDVTSVIPGVGATNLGKAEDAARVTGDTGVMTLVVRDDVLEANAEVDTDLDYMPLRADNFGALWNALTADDGARIPANSTSGLKVDLGADNDVSITGTVDTELPAAAALTDAFANPTVPGVGAFLMGWNGADWDRVDTANTGRLQVDVITGGGSEPTPTGATASETTSAALAAGSSVNLDSAELTELEFLTKVTCTSSVPFKAILSTVENTVASVVVTFFGKAGETVQFDPPHRTYLSASNTAGTDVFRVNMTNMDTSEAADVYASFFYQNN